jgi:hypothetical protein
VVDQCAHPPGQDASPLPTATVWTSCRDGIPYIGYRVVLADPTVSQIDIDVVDLDGKVFTRLEGSPLEDSIVYPGASLDPRGWPGWDDPSGDSWLADASTTRLRDGGSMVIDDGRGHAITVAYRAVPTACGDPSPSTAPPGDGGDSRIDQVVSASWECAPDPSIGFVYEVTAVDGSPLEDASTVEVRFLDRNDNPIRQPMVVALKGAIPLATVMAGSGDDEPFFVKLEFHVLTADHINVPLSSDCRLVEAGQVFTALGDQESEAEVHCGGQFAYRAVFFSPRSPDAEPAANAPVSVQATLVIPRQVTSDEAENRRIELNVPIIAGEMKTVLVPVRVKRVPATTVDARLEMTVKNTNQNSITAQVDDAEPTVVRTPCVSGIERAHPSRRRAAP